MTPSNKGFSGASKLVLTIAATLCMLIAVAAVVVKKRDDSVKAKAQEIFTLYQNNPQVPDPQTFEAFHQQGMSLATGILMNKAEKAGNLIERDRLFTDAFQRFSDIELSTLMFGHRPLFDASERQSRLKAAEAAALKNPATAKIMVESATSTIPEALQSRMQACYEVLAQKYLSDAGKTPVVRMAWDGFFGTRSCHS